MNELVFKNWNIHQFNNSGNLNIWISMNYLTIFEIQIFGNHWCYDKYLA